MSKRDWSSDVCSSDLFVQMASVDEISGHIVDNIVELARKPGLNIVAEGVETQEQADLMIGKGVHFLQGYLFSPPVPGEKFVTERSEERRVGKVCEWRR